jgi:Asp-tRNA(Asn)/Glu-tRNA(Gln) amidotransferase A subunit family amidase
MKFVRLLVFGTLLLMATGARAQNSVKPFPLDEATISEVHAAYKSGTLTSVKLVQAYLDRIRACDQAGPKLNVVIFLNPELWKKRPRSMNIFAKPESLSARSMESQCC